MMAALYLAAVVALGFAVARLLWPGPRAWTGQDWMRLAAAPAIGTGLAACLYFGLRLVLGMPPAAALAALAISAAGAAALAWVRSEPDSGQRQEAGQPAPVWLWVIFGLIAAAALLTVLMLTAMAPHGEWDAWSIWNLRARFLFRGQELASAFSPKLAWSHPDYPLLVPGAIALGWHAGGREVGWLAQVLQLLFLCSAVLAAMWTVWRRRGMALALVGGTWILGATGMTRIAASLYADIPLAAFCTLAGCFLFLALTEENGSRGLLLLSGLSAGLAAWTKNEGMLFCLALGAAACLPAIWDKGHRQRLSQLPWMLAGMVPGLAVVGHFRYHMAPANDAVHAASLALLPSRLADPARLWTAFAGMAEAAWTFGGFLLPVAAVLALWLALVRFRAPSAAAWTVLAAVCLQVAGYFVYYAALSTSLVWQLSTSAERILLHVWPLAVAGVLLLSGEIDAPQPQGSRARLKK